MVKRRYKQFCPTARTLDVVGERWTLLVVRDLLRGPRRYTDLRNGLPGMASNLLAQRLGEMEEAGLVRREHRVDPDPRDVYVLTPRGEELKPVLLALGRYGLAYLDLPTEDEPVNGETFAEGLATLLLPEELPDHDLVIHFALEEGDFTMRVGPAGAPGRRRALADRVEVVDGLWGPADVTVTASMLSLLLLRRGDITSAAATAQGLLATHGPEAQRTQVAIMFGFDRDMSVGDRGSVGNSMSVES